MAAILDLAAVRLAAAGVDSPHRDARLLMAMVLDVAPQSLTLRADRVLNGGEAERLEVVLARRAAREPISRILGRRGFWTLDLAIGPDTLDPRPDSETVIEAVLAALPDRGHPWRLLDFGTGSGCLLLALLAELPQASGLGIDRAEGALRVAAANAVSCGLSERVAFVCADWGAALNGWFDVILANPPYIPDEEIAGLEPEVAMWEPRLALAGGADGLDCYRRLAPYTARLLAPGGVAAWEVGQGQAGAVANLLTAAGLTVTALRPDLAGVDRCVVARRPA